VKGYKVKSAKEKGAWTKSEGKLAQVSKSSVLGDSHRTCLIPPALNCDNMGEMLSTRKLLNRDSGPRLLLRAVPIGPFSLAGTRILKAGVQHKP